jgi:mono/diheme cytochrome c family protein
MRITRRVFSLAIACLLAANSARAQPEDDEFAAGLIGSYSDSNEASFARIDRSIAFDWRQHSPDRRLAAGNFQVQWRGYLMTQANGQYQLHAYVAGQLQVKLNGKVVLESDRPSPGWVRSQPLDLPFDFHPFEATYNGGAGNAIVKLFWSGPRFQLEPISGRYFFHDPAAAPDDKFERGEALVRALRCAVCHDVPGEPQPSRAPALDRLAGNMHRQWLVDWLTEDQEKTTNTARRMPHFGLNRSEAEAVAAFLIRESKTTPKQPGDKKKVNRAAGEELFLTLGCLACHQLGALGSPGRFGGGDLADIAAKRPTRFFEHWLAKPAELNRHHRMPVFDLSKDERRNLAAYLANLGKPPERNEENKPAGEQLELGKRLFTERRCAACHGDAEQAASAPRTSIADVRDWERSCLQQADAARHRPGYQLAAKDREAIEHYLASAGKIKNQSIAKRTGQQILADHNCLSCHARNDSRGLAEELPQVAEAHPKLAALLPAMTPPPLIGLGDKLFDKSIREAIQRKSVYRDYLRVRMPKFRLSDEELQTLVDHFVEADRIPELEENPPAATTDPLVLLSAGGRLVTTDGFGCTSCHQVGRVLPVKAPVNARGPQLTMMGDRIRREWFDRFVSNPLRIIPRMEMPSVQVAVRGVLDDDLDKQLGAVWDALNTPDFEPPLPNPVRIVRHSGIADRHERPIAITDVVRDGKTRYVKPLLIGLPNRHSMLFDLEKAALTRWSIGDVARQQTEGKTWFWEAAGSELLRMEATGPELLLFVGTETLVPIYQGQFATEFDELFHVPGGLGFRHRLHFPNSIVARITQTFRPMANGLATGIERTIEIEGLPEHDGVRLRLFSGSEKTTIREDRRSVTTDLGSIQLVAPVRAELDMLCNFQVDTVVTDDSRPLRVGLQYTTTAPIDQFPLVPPQPPAPVPQRLNVVPGFETVRLPIRDEFMPTAFAWRPNKEPLVASLKGRVWSLRDTDGDGLEDQSRPISEELAAPYGLAATDQHIDVVNKYGLLRLFDEDGDGHHERTVAIASGWGHTADYHDWVVGLPQDEDGNYYVAIPCQQDERSQKAAHLRGTVLKLVPREPTPDNPRLFGIEPLTAGHRFPMGIARNRAGEMFVTDNQGNYNPFNELNHIVSGKRFGFINKVERKPDFKPPLTPPAIDLPHPWTRSVNGICFLETPEPMRKQLRRDSFGPFEGHLVGCEYDTRRLIRMSLHQVGETYQGAAYPFSYDAPPSRSPFLGPLVCAISPQGDLYVGGIRDSGWGAGNNIGEIARIRPQLGKLPCGIAEVRATQDGFEIDFTSPIDPAKAADPDNYSLASYTRISTPAYGGPDRDRRQEKVASITIRDDGRQAKLTLGELREGFVYELRLKPLAKGDGSFFPAEAHYTLRVIPN